MDAQQRQEVIERLWDLRHDLGKYLRMPLAYLPPEADDVQVRRSLERALVATYKRGSRILSAQELWHELASAIPASLGTRRSYRSLQRRVETALAWRHHVDRPGLAREEALADFDAVILAIDMLLYELEDEDSRDL